MRSLYLEGKTLSEVGGIFGLSRTHIHHLLKNTYGIVGADGGKSIQARVARERTEKRRVAYARQHFDLSYEEYRKLVKHPGKPTRKFACHRSRAARRGISWKFTFAQWWSIWLQSGKWNERGCGHDKYVMCRKGDVGPYSPDNVYVAISTHNNSVRPQKISGFPIGVSRQKKRFCANRMIDGKRYRIGLFDTPEEAGAAYQNFFSSFAVVASSRENATAGAQPPSPVPAVAEFRGIA